MRRRRFLGQFQGKGSGDPLMINRDLVHLTGATVSSWSIAAGVKKALPGLPGAFGEEEEEENPSEVEEPTAKRVRVSVAPPTQASTSKVEPVPKPKSFKEIQAEHDRLKKERE